MVRSSVNKAGDGAFSAFESLVNEFIDRHADISRRNTAETVNLLRISRQAAAAALRKQANPLNSAVLAALPMPRFRC